MRSWWRHCDCFQIHTFTTLAQQGRDKGFFFFTCVLSLLSVSDWKGKRRNERFMRKNHSNRVKDGCCVNAFFGLSSRPHTRLRFASVPKWLSSNCMSLLFFVSFSQSIQRHITYAATYSKSLKRHQVALRWAVTTIHPVFVDFRRPLATRGFQSPF